MGLWWKSIPYQNIHENGIVHFKGDSSALSKRWPVLWRYCQDWYILSVHEIQPSWFRFRPSDGYRLYFVAAEVAMEFRGLIRTRYVAVRVGPTPVSFWAKSSSGRHIRLSKTGAMIPANRCRFDHSQLASQQMQEYLKSLTYV